MARPRRAVATLCWCLALSSGLIACDNQETSTPPGGTGSPTPAVCQTLDDLGSSVEDLQDVEIGENALSAVRDELSDIQAELGQLSEDASGEYSGEIDAVRSAADSLESSVEAATASPSSASLAAVADDVRSLGSAFGNLSEALGDTC